MTTETNPTSPALTDEQAAVEARRIIADFATNYRDHAPVPQYGDAPPVPQPGRPPMSQTAVDVSTMMLSASVASVPIGGMTALVLYVIGHADPTSLAIGAAAPISLAIPILALCRLAGRAKQVVEAAPPVIHQHYTGPVAQKHIHSRTGGVWVKNTNQQ